MPGAVRDSSVLIHLATLGRFQLLRTFYGTVDVPPSVWREVVEGGRNRTAVAEMLEAQESGWLNIAAPTNFNLWGQLQRILDAGETEAIALALETPGAVLLVDEADARRVAENFGIAKIGTIGILIQAKLSGHLNSVKEELDKLRYEGRFRVSESLYHQAIQAAGEE